MDQGSSKPRSQFSCTRRTVPLVRFCGVEESQWLAAMRLRSATPALCGRVAANPDQWNQQFRGMTSPASPNITSVLKEMRQFPPSAAFAAEAHVKSMGDYEKLYARADRDPEGYWAEQAESLSWFTKWTKVLEWKEP